MSTERVIVPAAIYDALCTSLREAWEGFEHGDKLTVYSSTSSERIRKMVDQAMSMGARNVIDTTGEVTLSGNDVRPMILGPVTPAMDLYRDESFGPLAVLIVVSDRSLSEQQLVEEMLRIANDSEYGLSAAVWSKDVEKAMTMAERLQCGAVHINSPVSCHMHLVRDLIADESDRRPRILPTSLMEAGDRLAGDVSMASKDCGDLRR